jgi:RNA polymerase sigma-70 factor (ECF subfamily)
MAKNSKEEKFISLYRAFVDEIYRYIFLRTGLESRIVFDCLNRIPEHYRTTLMLKYVDGKSVKQIAQLTDKSAKAVESLLQRAKSTFLKEYRLSRMKEGFDP